MNSYCESLAIKNTHTRHVNIFRILLRPSDTTIVFVDIIKCCNNNNAFPLSNTKNAFLFINMVAIKYYVFVTAIRESRFVLQTYLRPTLTATVVEWRIKYRFIARVGNLKVLESQYCWILKIDGPESEKRNRHHPFLFINLYFVLKVMYFYNLY